MPVTSPKVEQVTSYYESDVYDSTHQEQGIKRSLLFFYEENSDLMPV